MTKVEFKAENINMCQCPNCPVQAGSECFQQHIKESKPILLGETELPDPKTLVRLYCSIGKSICRDLDEGRACICPSCPVWTEYYLSSRYFCLKGSANEIEKW